MFLAVFVDVFILSRKLRKRLTEKFGEVERGTVWYGSMRSLQFRRLRLPKPLVRRGEFRLIKAIRSPRQFTNCRGLLCRRALSRKCRLPRREG